MKHAETHRSNVVAEIVCPQRRTGKVAVRSSELNGFLLAETKREECGNGIRTHRPKVDSKCHHRPIVIHSTEVRILGVGKSAIGLESTADIIVGTRLESQTVNSISSIVPVSPFRLVGILRENLLRLPVHLVVGKVIGSIIFPLSSKRPITSNPLYKLWLVRG